MATTIQISDELWEKLNKLKKKGESFEDVILREIRKSSSSTKSLLSPSGVKPTSSGAGDLNKEEEE